MKCILGAVLIFLTSAGFSQVANDNIEDRILLELNQTVQSTTVGSTVQWKCLNQDLTRSCIKYHNDQWFVFKVPDSGRYYINLSQQECRDIFGVQVLVFSGKPCQPETYNLISCYSDGNKDDVFVTLEGLNPDEYYLLNIDGYLNDQCGFALELSDQPKGLPVAVAPVGESTIEANLRAVSVSWEIPDSLSNAFRSYEIWREVAAKSELIAVEQHSMNAFGENRLSYSYIDTLFSTQATYAVVGSGDMGRTLVAKETIKLNQAALAEAPENIISVNLGYTKGDELSLELWDADSDKLLFTRNLEFDPEVNGNVRFRVKYYRDAGVKFFKVIIRNHTTRKSDLQFFEK